MIINEDMKDTNRIAIKLDNGGKIIIERRTLQDCEHYLISVSKGSFFKINEEKVDFNNSLLKLYNLEFIDNGIIIKGILIKNMSLKTVYFANDAGQIKSYETSYIKEPEEPTITIDINVFIKGVKKVIVDSQMFKEMLEESVVTGSASELAKYNLIPNFSLIEENKIKQKRKNKSLIIKN